MLIPYYALAFLNATTAIGYIYGYLDGNPDLYGKLGFAFGADILVAYCLLGDLKQ